MLERVLDVNSFVEQNALIADAGVECGYGTVDGRLVYVYRQTGYVTKNHAMKIADVYAKAVSFGAPVIGVLNAGGMKLDDGLCGLDAYGAIYTAQAKASGIIPQISVIEGDCMGASAIIAAMSDFIIISDKGRFFLQSPNVLTDDDKKEKSAAHFCTEAPEETVRDLLNFIPFNNCDEAVTECIDDINREDGSLTEASDIFQIIKSISDNGKYLEILKGKGNTVTALAKLSGITVGILGCNGLLDTYSIRKLTNFIRFSDAFHIPLISLSDAVGYGFNQSEDAGVLMEIASLVNALSSVSAGKINLITKNALGSAYVVLNSKHIGADVVYAWPGAKFALLDKRGSEKVLKTGDEYTALQAAQLGYVDAVIESAATRKRLIAALEMLYSKRINPIKKHSTK